MTGLDISCLTRRSQLIHDSGRNVNGLMLVSGPTYHSRQGYVDQRLETARPSLLPSGYVFYPQFLR